jgi:hypothetical protein
MFSYNPHRTGVVCAIDGRELWLLHNDLRDDEASPLIAPDGEAPPAYSMGSYTPSTVPGCRLPHF